MSRISLRSLGGVEEGVRTGRYARDLSKSEYAVSLIHHIRTLFHRETYRFRKWHTPQSRPRPVSDRAIYSSSAPLPYAYHKSLNAQIPRVSHATLPQNPRIPRVSHRFKAAPSPPPMLFLDASPRFKVGKLSLPKRVFWGGEYVFKYRFFPVLIPE